MTMAIAQVRLPEGLVQEMDDLIGKGLYTNKSEVMRDALRRLLLETQIGSMPNTGDSVQEIREIRKKLSSQFSKDNLQQINALGP